MALRTDAVGIREAASQIGGRMLATIFWVLDSGQAFAQRAWSWRAGAGGGTLEESLKTGY